MIEILLILYMNVVRIGHCDLHRLVYSSLTLFGAISFSSDATNLNSFRFLLSQANPLNFLEFVRVWVGGG